MSRQAYSPSYLVDVQKDRLHYRQQSYPGKDSVESNTFTDHYDSKNVRHGVGTFDESSQSAEDVDSEDQRSFDGGLPSKRNYGPQGLNDQAMISYRHQPTFDPVNTTQQRHGHMLQVGENYRDNHSNIRDGGTNRPSTEDYENGNSRKSDGQEWGRDGRRYAQQFQEPSGNVFGGL